MPRPRAAMRKIREALRLCLAEGLSPRQAGVATGSPRTTVRRYVVRAVEVGLGWPLPPELDDRELEERLCGRAAPPPTDLRPVPDWGLVHRELRRKGVTLQLLWTEYRAAPGSVPTPAWSATSAFCRMLSSRAGVTQLAECLLPKQNPATATAATWSRGSRS